MPKSDWRRHRIAQPKDAWTAEKYHHFDRMSGDRSADAPASLRRLNRFRSSAFGLQVCVQYIQGEATLVEEKTPDHEVPLVFPLKRIALLIGVALLFTAGAVGIFMLDGDPRRLHGKRKPAGGICDHGNSHVPGRWPFPLGLHRTAYSCGSRVIRGRPEAQTRGAGASARASGSAGTSATTTTAACRQQTKRHDMPWSSAGRLRDLALPPSPAFGLPRLNCRARTALTIWSAPMCCSTRTNALGPRTVFTVTLASSDKGAIPTGWCRDWFFRRLIIPIQIRMAGTTGRSCRNQSMP